MPAPGQGVRAQGTPPNAVALRLERVDNAIYLNTSLAFDLPQGVEEALLKGIAIYFVAEVDVIRERWYWSNLNLVHLQRHLRLVYHPLTRRWRLSIAADGIDANSQGVALNQNFDNLQNALEGIKRLTPWRLLDTADLGADQHYFLNFRFGIDLTQLPRPLQIGTLGQSDWQIAISARQDIRQEAIP